MSDAKYINDLADSTIQQLFVPVCMPRSPNIHRGPGFNTGPDEIISLYTCEDCNEKFVLQSSFKVHKDRCSVQIKYNCRECNRDLVFYNRCNFLGHLRMHNLELNEQELSALEVTTRPIPESMMPYFTLTEYREANDPCSTTKANQNVCTACPECKASLTCTLQEHFNIPRSNEKKWNSCEFCNLILPTKCSLRAHKRIHTKVGTLMCPECCISFPIWDRFWNHISNVCFHRHKILRYECHKCALIFKDRRKLQEHFSSRHFPQLNRMVGTSGHFSKTEFNILKSCDLCGTEVPHCQLKAHLLSHSNDKSALNIVYQCPHASCSYSCEEFCQFKKHITSCLYLHTNSSKATTEESISSPRSQERDTSEITNGRTKQALDILKSKSNIVVHRIESKINFQAQQSSASGRGFRNIVRMPLTPSPEPLSESSGQGHYNKDKQRAGHTTPKVNKAIPGLGESILVSQLDNCSHELFHDDPVNEADVLLVKMHQCTICKELIAYDRKNDALKIHFRNVHQGKYKLGQIKRGFGDTVTSHGEISTSGSDKDIESDEQSMTSSIVGVSSRNCAKLEDTPPLLKKQKPLAISPRRLANTNRKEAAVFPRKSWEIVSVVDSDDECLLNVKNRAMQQQQIGTARTLINGITQLKSPPKMLTNTSINKKPVPIENDLLSDSSSDSGPAYKRKRKRGSSTDPDFDCRELIGYQPKLKERLPIRSRRRTLDRKSTKTANQDREAEPITPQKQRNGFVKKRKGVQESKQKSPHATDLKAYYSNAVSEYKVMGSGIDIPTVDFRSNNLHCLKPGCSYASNDSEAFREHILTHRTDDNTFQCMECGICFVVKTTFAKHLIINHTIKDVDAYIKENDCCDKELIDININELERLEKRKTENVPMVLLENQCKICYKVCADSLSLNNHFRTHGMAFLRMNQQEKNK